LEFPFSSFECDYEISLCSLQTLEEIKNLEEVTDATVGANCSGLRDYFTSQRFLLTVFTFKKTIQHIRSSYKTIPNT